MQAVPVVLLFIGLFISLLAVSRQEGRGKKEASEIEVVVEHQSGVSSAPLPTVAGKKNPATLATWPQGFAEWKLSLWWPLLFAVNLAVAIHTLSEGGMPWLQAVLVLVSGIYARPEVRRYWRLWKQSRQTSV